MKREILMDTLIKQVMIGMIIVILSVGLILGLFIDGWCRQLYFGWLNSFFYGEYLLYCIRLVVMDSFTLIGLFMYIKQPKSLHIVQKSRNQQQALWKRKVLNTIFYLILLVGLVCFNRAALKDLPTVLNGEYASLKSDEYLIKTSGTRSTIYTVVVQTEVDGKLESKHIEVTKTQSQVIQEKKKNKETISFYYLPNTNILLKLESAPQL